MLRNFTLLALLLFSIISCTEETKGNIELNSPGENLSLSFSLNSDGVPYYLLKSDNQLLVDTSRLGFELKNEENFKDGFRVSSVKYHKADTVWTQVWGQNKEIEDIFSAVDIELLSENNFKMNLYFKLYNDGLGFRYAIPQQERIDSIVVLDELTEFNLTDVEKAWWIWADYDSYERLYNTTALDSAQWVATPFTLKRKDGKYLSIHEANLTNYAGMTLRQKKAGVFESELVPWANGDKVRASKKLISPWRTIQVSGNAGGLIESNLILNLNEENKIEDVSWIKPMTYIGVWWSMHIGTETWAEGNRHGATTENSKKYIDFAKENNVGGVVVEGWNKGWDKWGAEFAFDHISSANDFSLKEVADYAREKGVYLIGHNETGGDIKSYEKYLPQAFELYEKLGIRAVKTGYAGGIYPRGEHHHGQMMVEHYRKVVEMAAKHKIMLDVHEPIKATGIRRTYPNMMTREGVRGMEWNAWSDGNPPSHTLILPFTRALGGPVDYTPGIFDVELKNFNDKRVAWNADDISKTRVHTTLSKQLALMVILYSPLQMASDLLENYQNHPAFEFVSKMETTFDESKIINGEIGEYITVARRSGNKWFLASATNEVSREIKLPLAFLEKGKEYTALSINDKEGSNWLNNPSEYKIEKNILTSNDVLDINLAEGGGYLIILEEN